MVNRRAFLAKLTPVIGIISGCHTTNNMEIHVESIKAQNLDREPHTVHLLLLVKGNVKYWNSKEIPGFSEEENTAYVRSFQGVPSEPANYELFAKVDGKKWKSFDVGGFNSDCYMIELEINKEGLLFIEYSLCKEG